MIHFSLFEEEIIACPELDYSYLQLRISMNGAVIKETIKGEIKKYSITADFSKNDKPYLSDEFKKYALCSFDSENEALVWCKQNSLKVLRIEKEL